METYTVKPKLSAKRRQSIYLPGLNGLRAIAAFAVLISHTTIQLTEFGLNNKILGTYADGAIGSMLAGYGVTIFFTLSGFLITYLLLKEKEKTGGIKIKDFYVRRVLRIWPLYYSYLAACLVTLVYYGIEFNASSVPFYIFLAANVPFIMGETLPYMAHYWSLGVEEQFYLFFPQIARLSNKRLFRISIGLVIGLLCLKAAFWLYMKKTGNELPLTAISVTRFQSMLVGVIGAILFFKRNQLFIKITTSKVVQAVSWLCIVLIAVNKFHMASVIDSELVSFIALFLIMGQVTKRNNIINLENKLCDFIGKISYGIYVIHLLLIFFIAKIVGKVSPVIMNYILIYVLVIGSTVLIAFLSYEFFEKRFLRLKRKYSTIHSDASKSEHDLKLTSQREQSMRNKE